MDLEKAFDLTNREAMRNKMRMNVPMWPTVLKVCTKILNSTLRVVKNEVTGPMTKEVD